jgi:NAD(P)-binding Rossmann-like domain
MPSLSTTSLWCVIAAAAARGATAFDIPNILIKDVAIIGGGAAGAYAGVRLRDDYNKSIALVEMQGRLASKTDASRHLPFFP